MALLIISPHRFFLSFYFEDVKIDGVVKIANLKIAYQMIIKNQVG